MDASSEGEHRNMVNYRDEWLLQTALILLTKGENLCVWMLPNNLKGGDCYAKLSLIELVGNISSLCADMMEITTEPADP